MKRKVVIQCPLCAWKREFPVFTPYALAAEITLKQHLEVHSLQEWLQKVSSLQWELDQLKATFP